MLSLALPGLVDPKSVESRYGMHNAKEVLSPLRVTEYNHIGADPHYCSTTSNLQVLPISHTGQLLLHSALWDTSCTFDFRRWFDVPHKVASLLAYVLP